MAVVHRLWPAVAACLLLAALPAEALARAGSGSSGFGRSIGHGGGLRTRGYGSGSHHVFFFGGGGGGGLLLFVIIVVVLLLFLASRRRPRRR
jgi:hypothetical protein